MKIVLKGIIISFAITVAAFIIAAFILWLTEFSENKKEIFVSAATFISIFSGSFAATRKLRKSGLVYGATIGGIYIVILYLLGLAFYPFAISMNVIKTLLISIITGGVGGLLGVNIKLKKKDTYPKKHY